jgi:hypothetical protein
VTSLWDFPASHDPSFPKTPAKSFFIPTVNQDFSDWGVQNRQKFDPQVSFSRNFIRLPITWSSTFKLR